MRTEQSLRLQTWCTRKRCVRARRKGSAAVSQLLALHAECAAQREGRQELEDRVKELADSVWSYKITARRP